MHELSIALSIIDIASEEAERLGNAPIAAVHLKWGPLSGVVKEALVSAFELAREGSPLARSSLVVEDVPITLQCDVCGGERPVVSIQELCCEVCGAPASKILGGRELVVVAMEFEE